MYYIRVACMYYIDIVHVPMYYIDIGHGNVLILFDSSQNWVYIFYQELEIATVQMSVWYLQKNEFLLDWDSQYSKLSI